MALLGLTEYLDLAPQWIYCLRLLIALFCGVILGAERTFRSKDAGIRTHAVLASGAALFMIVSKYAFLDLGLPAWSQGFDPTLVAGFIIDGSGFLCAGIICSRPDGDIITGMTTAANIWATAAIGMACGCGLELLGISCTLLLLLNHWFLSLRGVQIMPLRTLKMTVKNTPQVRQLLKQAQKDFGIRPISARYSRSDEEGTVQVQLQIRSKKPIRFEDTVRFLDAHPEVKDISI
ncbi:MAG: MgtC/SapB family protein [Clostridia bacterium]|nr:MgtC/SapB family protein [Clostridia bacterium]